MFPWIGLGLRASEVFCGAFLFHFQIIREGRTDRKLNRVRQRVARVGSAKNRPDFQRYS